jgi:hypothetical protein
MAELMELTLNQTYFGQKCVNRWNYVASGTPAAVTLSFALTSIMGFLSTDVNLLSTTVGGSLQAVQNVDAIFNSVIARAVYIDDDFYDSPFLSGTHGGASGGSGALSPTSAYGFFSSRVKQSIARGYKRFVGISESSSENGGEIVSGALTALEAVAGYMSDTLVYDDEGESLTFIPCIVQKEKYTVVDSGKDAYRYYADEAEQLVHTAQGILWTPYDQIRTQVSRQYGRGQ